MLKKISEKFWDIWEDPESMGQKAVRASAITFVERGLSKIIQLIRTIIIARLLFPDDLGLFGLAALTMATTEVFFQHGFNSAIVQEKEDVKKYLDSAWTVNLIRNVFLFFLLFFVGAPLGAWFFQNSEVLVLARAVSFVFLISAFDNIGIVLLEREMKLNRRFAYTMIGTLIQVSAVIAAAFFLRNVWALVIGLLVGTAAYTILSYIFHSYRPRFSFDFSGAKHLFRFGKWIGLTGIAMFIASRGDSVVLGRLLEPSDLAFYGMAFSIGTLPAVELVNALGGVLFPLYSRIQADIEQLKNVFTSISRLVYSLMLPATAGLFVLAHEIIKYILGSRWLGVEPILYVVILFGLVKSFGFLIDPLLRGIGKPQAGLTAFLVQAGVMFSVIFPLTNAFGSVGTAWSLLAGLFVSQIVLFFKARKEVGLRLRNIAETLYLPVLGSLFMYFIIVFAKSFVPVDSLFKVVFYIVFGAFFYAVFVFYADKAYGSKLLQSILWIKRNI